MASSGKVLGDILEWQFRGDRPAAAILRIWRVVVTAYGHEREVEVSQRVQQQRERGGNLDSLSALNAVGVRRVSVCEGGSWLRMRIASKTIPGTWSTVPEQVAIVPLDVPVSLSSTSSIPNTDGWPAACRLVVSVATN